MEHPNTNAVRTRDPLIATIRAMTEGENTTVWKEQREMTQYNLGKCPVRMNLPLLIL